MSERASDSGEKARVKTSVFNSQSYVGMGLVITIASLAFLAGKLTTKSDDGLNLLSSEIENMRKESKAAAIASTAQIENLRQEIELRASNRNKEIEAIDKRLDSHEVSIHELFLSIRGK